MKRYEYRIREKIDHLSYINILKLDLIRNKDISQISQIIYINLNLFQII